MGSLKAPINKAIGRILMTMVTPYTGHRGLKSYHFIGNLFDIPMEVGARIFLKNVATSGIIIYDVLLYGVTITRNCKQFVRCERRSF